MSMTSVMHVLSTLSATAHQATVFLFRSCVIVVGIKSQPFTMGLSKGILSQLDLEGVYCHYCSS